MTVRRGTALAIFAHQGATALVGVGAARRVDVRRIDDQRAGRRHPRSDRLRRAWRDRRHSRPNTGILNTCSERSQPKPRMSEAVAWTMPESCATSRLPMPVSLALTIWLTPGPSPRRRFDIAFGRLTAIDATRARRDDDRQPRRARSASEQDRASDAVPCAAPLHHAAAPFADRSDARAPSARRRVSAADRCRHTSSRPSPAARRAASRSRRRICPSRCLRWPIMPRTSRCGRSIGSPCAGIIDAVVALHQLVEAGHIVRHVAIGRRDDGGRPAHHMIAGEQRACLRQREGEMVRGVAGRGDRGQRPACARDLLAVGEDAVGRIIAVERGVGARAEIVERERCAADDRRAGRRLERARWRGCDRGGCG